MKTDYVQMAAKVSRALWATKWQTNGRHTVLSQLTKITSFKAFSKCEGRKDVMCAYATEHIQTEISDKDYSRWMEVLDSHSESGLTRRFIFSKYTSIKFWYIFLTNNLSFSKLVYKHSHSVN